MTIEVNINYRHRPGTGQTAKQNPVTTPMITREMKTEELQGMDDIRANRVRVLESKDLFGGNTEILIRHDDAVYRMKITRQGKLILNK